MSRIVLVTGGTSGIGRAIAAKFAAHHADVIITGRRAETVERSAHDLGVDGFVCDATDPAQVAALDDRVARLDVLVNAAGGLPEASAGATPLESVLAEWQSSLDQNLLTAILTTTAVKDKLAPDGSIVSMGSIGAERRGGSYGAAKAALAAWNAVLSAEVGPQGITSNVIAAGFVAETNFFRGALTDERRDAYVQEAHNKRAGNPEDIAEAAYFLASPGARHITGQTIHVNGGAFTTR